MLTLSLAAPAYNEGEILQNLVESWRDFLLNHPQISQFEIVICNDGSQDNTKSILDTLSQTYPEIRALHFEQNHGASAALAAAIAATRYDWVFLLDTDGQFPIENLTLMLESLKQNSIQAVVGVRNKKSSAYERWGSKLSGMICNLFHGSQLRDFNSACKLVQGNLLRACRLETKGMNYSTEITSRLLESKVGIAEVDIDHRARQAGKSNMKLLRDSVHRFLFVSYLGLRQLLIKLEIIR